MNDDVCPICIETLLSHESFRLPECRHRFHVRCFLDYMAYTYTHPHTPNNTHLPQEMIHHVCPICRHIVLSIPRMVVAEDLSQEENPSPINTLRAIEYDGHGLHIATHNHYHNSQRVMGAFGLLVGLYMLMLIAAYHSKISPSPP